jgi:hypothetical protein
MAHKIEIFVAALFISLLVFSVGMGLSQAADLELIPLRSTTLNAPPVPPQTGGAAFGSIRNAEQAALKALSESNSSLQQTAEAALESMAKINQRPSSW